MASMTHKQLGQARPGDTNAVSIYSPGSSTQAIIKNIVIANTSGSAATFRIFHDDDGSTFDETTALFWDIAIAANTSVSIDSAVLMDDNTGNLAVRTSINDALTFTVYGAEIA